MTTANGTIQAPDMAALIAECDRLIAENAKLKTQRSPSLSLKVSDKGGVSVYGMGKWPVTLYAEQWVKLLAIAPQIQQFIQDNASSMTHK